MVTPACARTKAGYISFNVTQASHPRACADEGVRECQSPPRVRGRKLQGLLQFFVYYVTPARARTKVMQRLRSPVLHCHPRACADESLRESSTVDYCKSPPRVRGRKSHGDQPKRKLRYPSHDTLGCFSSSRPYRLALNRLRGRSVC